MSEFDDMNSLRSPDSVVRNIKKENLCALRVLCDERYKKRNSLRSPCTLR
jgi:hypothetical protein